LSIWVICIKNPGDVAVPKLCIPGIHPAGKVYNVKGRLVRTLLNNGSTCEVVFDGLDDDKRKMSLGMFFIARNR